MCIESPFIVEVPHPATSDNVGAAEKIEFWMELNFSNDMELFAPYGVETDAPEWPCAAGRWRATDIPRN
jgi:hypothetical protein